MYLPKLIVCFLKADINYFFLHTSVAPNTLYLVDRQHMIDERWKLQKKAGDELI